MRGRVLRRLAGALAACASLAGGAARAGDLDLFSRQTVSGLVDLRIAAADGEPSWLRGGYGKAGVGGGGEGDFAVRPLLDLATVAWRPRLGGDLSAYVTLQTQPGQDKAIDVGEAFLSWRPTPRSDTRFSGRAGLFWPPFSPEHDGVAWTTTRTLTPSAINTWIAEEVKVAGLEATVQQDLPGHRLSLTGAVFADNDTSGTLLSYRGWGLHDVRTTLFGSLPLPRFSPRFAASHPGQNQEAFPAFEIDGRPGAYAKLEWRPPAPVVLDLAWYDNGANPHLFERGQWAWRTSFHEAGLTWKPTAEVEVLAQAMNGRTYFGVLTPNGWYVDVRYTAAYVLATWTRGRHRLTGRADAFSQRDRSFQRFGNTADDEDGWALTGDYAYALRQGLTLWLEAVRIDSNRPIRGPLGFAPRQEQLVLQAALRTSF